MTNKEELTIKLQYFSQPLLTFSINFFNTKMKNCLVVMCHNARRTAALRKYSAIIPLVIVGVLIHGAGKSKEQKSGEDQAVLKVQSCDKWYSHVINITVM